MSETTAYTSTSTATYDSSLIESSGSVWKLKDLRPSNASLYDSFSSSTTADWGDGSLTRTLTGGATVSSSLLDCSGFSGKYASYSATSNFDFAQIGCARIRFKTGYSGNPASDNSIISITDSGLNNLIRLQHTSAGVIQLFIANSTGGSIIIASLASWSPTAGTYYEIELNYDLTGGATRVFIDGTQIGATQTATGTRSAAAITDILLGTSYQGSELSDNTYSNMLLFSAVQHTGNYTPGAWSGISSTIFSVANPIITFTDTIRSDGLESITETSTLTGSDLIKYTHYGKYITGGAWATSDATYSQTSTASDNNTYASSLTTLPITITTVAYLHSDDGTTTPELTSLAIVYSFAGTSPTLTESVIWSYLYDLSGSVLSGKTIKCKAGWIINNSFISHGGYVSTTTGTDGYWEISIKYENKQPTSLSWVIDNKIIDSDFSSGNKSFDDLISTKYL